jgi:glyoxylate/hydroxypyruvate reductase A
MEINVLFAGSYKSWPEYEEHLKAAFLERNLSVSLKCEFSNPSEVDYIIYAPNSSFNDFSIFSQAKAVLSLWAGVENTVSNPTLFQPLCRMVDLGLTQGMVEYVVAHSLRYHLNLDQQVLQQDGIWRHDIMIPKLAQDQKIGILGLGALGSECALKLNEMGFNVLGWSRNQKKIPNIECLTGSSGFNKVLESSDILVLLLPLTKNTKYILNSKSLKSLKKGAFVINAGRGLLINDDALLSSINEGRVKGATLDVFSIEPLPSGHMFWEHPAITVTPHIAAETRPKTSSVSIAENIYRNENNLGLLNLVDKLEGY